MEDKDMLTAQEAANILGVHLMTVYQAMKEDRLPFEVIYGRKVVAREAVEAYQQRTRIDGAKPRGRPKGSKKQQVTE
jgi:excisionase family DNA binding protein